MKVKTKLALALAALLLGSACARRPAAPAVRESGVPEINYVVGPECHATAHLQGCDAASPPRCKTITLRYPRGCEQIAAQNSR